MHKVFGTYANRNLTRVSVIIAITASLFAIAAVASRPVMAATKTTKAAKGADAKAVDTHIKSDASTNAAAAGKGATALKVGVRPTKKGGVATKSGSGEADFNNYTGLWIKCYVDGVYYGTVAPYGDLAIYVGSGYHNLYARADYDDGTYNYWYWNGVYLGYADWHIDD